METIRSKDGTTIAFDRLGDDPPVIVVGGQLCDRALTSPTAEELASHFTVINYDRRGRGTASVYAHSSGAGLALHATAADLPIAKLVLHEPSYNPDGDEDRQRVSRKEAEHIKTLLAEDRRGDAIEYFWRSIGMPPEMVDQMRHTPRWTELEAMAHTMTYDSEVMGDSSTGGAVPTDLAGRVTTETLVLCGGASPEWIIDVGTRLAESLPNGRHCVLEGQEHVVPPEVLVPVLAEFFVDRNGAHHPTESRKKPRLPMQIPRPDTPR